MGVGKIESAAYMAEIEQLQAYFQKFPNRRPAVKNMFDEMKKIDAFPAFESADGEEHFFQLFCYFIDKYCGLRSYGQPTAHVHLTKINTSLSKQTYLERQKKYSVEATKEDEALFFQLVSCYLHT